ncbi:choline ABC transporter ATP-binding protein [Puniceibacterium confluentis]|uniref:choline ABC transporter ATP-binding protein n=1 Tax=Puniceibacterium confluentis TaxID=1958944 RepID=UPI0011B5E03B|nr:choline ABC transporter ATP-binding protein [Puniceibacterium confluentis]
MKKAVIFDKVCIMFGSAPQKALPLADQGKSRSEIQAETDQVLGVHNCSLDVDEGEILVLMGLSGSGKSTLLRSVNGLNPVVRGSVSVNDGGEMVDVAQCNAKTLRHIRQSRVAMVFQQFGLLPWRTVAENVGFGLELAGVPEGERTTRVEAQLALVGLSERADAKVAELSGGMQQRVGLARAFATEAPILLMDEPFSALDPLIRTRLQDELLELQARLKRTIIFVSHDLDEAFKLGGRIAIMEGGRIVQCGTPREIFSNPASDYVADFVANMNPLGVLTARDVMVPGEGEGGGVHAEMPVRDVMLRLREQPRLSVESLGQRIGVVTAQSIVDRLSV